MADNKKMEHSHNYKNTNINKNTTMSILGKNELADDLKMVKNTVFWSLNPGEVARRINVNEFANISNARGVYVQEGVIAVLMIDGRIVTKLSSGVYYFPTAIERFGSALKHIWQFFAGKKAGGNDNDDDIRRGRLGSELQNLGKQSLIDVVLVTEGVIPVVLGVKPVDGNMEFCPYTIHAQLADVEVGVSMNIEIVDFYKFRINYLTKNHSCRIHDIQATLNEPIRNTIQDVLAYEPVEAPVFSPEIRERLKNNIAAKVNAVLLGAQVSQIIDITLRNEDFERFRELEHKLYCSNKELDFLVRTNDFKNRLQDEENSQIIRNAKSEEELRYALDKVNKDKLLHEDEMVAFYTMLNAQNKIREAQSDADVENALRDIEKTKLISKDDFEALESELRLNKGRRSEVEEIFRWQSLRRTETERISAQKDIAIESAKADKEIEQTEYERDKQKQAHTHELEKDELEHIVYKNDVERAEVRKDDDYGDERRMKTHQMDVIEAKDALDLADDAEKREIERARIAQENALNALSKMKEEDRKDKAQDYEFSLETQKIGMEELRLKTGMTAEQLATLNFDKLDAKAQEKIAEAFSSRRDFDTYKQLNEDKMKMMQDFMDKTLSMKNDEGDRLERMMREMMSNNSDIAKSAVAGQRETMNSFMSAMKDVSTHRLNEVESDKREYKAEAHYAQSRMDHTQDSALRYTTRVSEADALKNSNVKVVYVRCWNCGAEGEQGGVCPECSSKL